MASFISSVANQFASLTIGMLGYWNTGIMGSGKMENWVIVKFILKEN
jgi:hypothetical protein